MDVDAPSVLKRCSSAPLINEGATGTPVSDASHVPDAGLQPTPTATYNMLCNNNQSRTRRFSTTSCSPLLQSPAPRLTPRVSQLRQEEAEAVPRELAHEREVHSALQMGASWEDLHLVAPGSPTRALRSPAVSPSPTRRSYTTRRSLSPIAIRPSCLSPVARPSPLGPLKRRLDEDDSPCGKRACALSRAPSAPATPESDSGLDCTFRPVSADSSDAS